MRKSAARASRVAAFVFLLEQLTKWIVLGPLDLRNVVLIELLPFFDLRYTENHGISLGLFQATSDTMRWVLVALTSAIAIGVGFWITPRGEDRRPDRARHGASAGRSATSSTGCATAMSSTSPTCTLASFRPFFIFNVADAAISIGVAILLLRAFLVKERPKENAEHA